MDILNVPLVWIHVTDLTFNNLAYQFSWILKDHIQHWVQNKRLFNKQQQWPEYSTGVRPTRPREEKLHRCDGSTHPGNPDCEESGESSSSGGSELEPSGHQLFCLEYESDNGEVTSVIVYQDDDPGRVSEEVSAHTPLDLPMREALKLRIQEEIAKRQSRH
uniref:Chromosome 2 open reading frame 68 n=1 Tax=Spermophilus dauricus TaxID=99837 RepID=A0A8C9PHR5_SPEDA